MDNHISYLNHLWHKIEQETINEKKAMETKRILMLKIKRYFIFFFLTLTLLLLPSLFISDWIQSVVYIISLFVIINALYIEKVIIKH